MRRRADSERRRSPIRSSEMYPSSSGLRRRSPRHRGTAGRSIKSLDEHIYDRGDELAIDVSGLAFRCIRGEWKIGPNPFHDLERRPVINRLAALVHDLIERDPKYGLRDAISGQTRNISKTRQQRHRR